MKTRKKYNSQGAFYPHFHVKKNNHMLQAARKKMRYLAFMMAGVIVYAILLSPFQTCIAEKIIPYVYHTPSLTQTYGTDHEGNNCSYLHVGCGILSTLLSNDNLPSKKDSLLPFSFVLLSLLLSGSIGRRIPVPSPQKSRSFYRNTILFKLSKVRLLI